jgi:glycosyltransferase involved in cell wall biosynthesis
MNNLLIITYYWPPGSGAGVQRWLKFSKYLPESGFEPVILTTEPEYAAYPATDPTLDSDIPYGVRVYKTRATDYFRIYKRDKTNIPSAGFATGDENNLMSKFLRFIRGNFFLPDPRRGWNKYAYKKACEIIENEGIRNIITTSPPHSTQLIGLKLKRKFPEIKWISDLRDPWTDIYYYKQFYHTFPARKIDECFEKNVLKTADRIITVGKSLKDLFASKISGIEGKFEILPNGFDEDDFKGLVSVTPDKFTISYIGTLSEAYPLEGFGDALRKIREMGNDFLLQFIGTISPKQKEVIISKAGAISVEFIPFVSHREAIKYMMESSLLLLIIPDHHSNKSIITGKLFEYLATGKPVLCIGPEDGDAAEILGITGHGRTTGYNDTDGIINIIDYYTRDLSGKPAPSEFSRKVLTRKLVSLL